MLAEIAPEFDVRLRRVNGLKIFIPRQYFDACIFNEILQMDVN